MTTKLIPVKRTLNSNLKMYLSWSNFLFDVHTQAELQGRLGSNCLQLVDCGKLGSSKNVRP